MFRQKEALVRLFQDDDPETVQLVKAQLAGRGRQAIPDLEELGQVDDERVSRHVAEVLGKIDSRVAAEELTVRCKNFPPESNLEEACWLLARVMIPGVRLEPYRRRLDDWSLELRRRLDPTAPARKSVLTLGHFLGQELGFTGAADNYYAPEHSLLPTLIDGRRGIPISLTLLYMLVAERAGLTVEGVNFPAHFLGRIGDVLFDPFGGGGILSIEEMDAILSSQNLTLQPAHLVRATPLAMFRRMLANLSNFGSVPDWQDDPSSPYQAQLTDWVRALHQQ